MTIRRDFPHPIREITNTWIPLADGTRIAARIWMPQDAQENPVPAILEYIPYRKNDGTAERDAIMQPYMAGFGYACVRVDMRGSGDSDGILYDEYLKQEQDDALEILAWLAEQPWCTGKIGMIGISWGGFNGLQIAARRPPQLKAIITVGSTDDRYSDDVHYMGGCVLGIEMLEWATAMLLYTCKPPDPLHVGERWREMWLGRLEKSQPMIAPWLGHQRRDAYWQHGSVCEDYNDIQIPVYAVNGWADGYTNSVLRLVQNLPGVRKGLIGPWGHCYPHDAYPGPSIGFLQECIRWFDRWLKDIENGIEHEPRLRAWILDSMPPSSDQPDWPGHWVAENVWPPPDASPQKLYLTSNGLKQEPSDREGRLEYLGSFQAGLNAGMWAPYGMPGDLPPDQRQDDGCSLTFDSPPLEETLEILGFPALHLELSVDKPNALVAVRLCDVAPTGASTLVSRGLLNLTHRESHLHPEPLEPGVRYRVVVQLNAIGYRLPRGHRWRVAVTPAYWPHAWPSPENVTLSVYANEHSYLALPVRPPRPSDDGLAPFLPAETSAPLEVEVLRKAPREWRINRDVPKGIFEVVDRYDLGLRRLVANDLTFGGLYQDIYNIQEGEPLSASVRCLRQHEMQRGDWRVRLVVNSSMSSDAGNFYVTNHVEAYEGAARIFARATDYTIKRDMV